MLPKERPFAFFPETRIRRGKVGRRELSSPRTPTVVNLIWIWHWPWRNVAGRIARASATDSVNDEWVQVRKSRTSPVDLSGWTLRDGRCAMDVARWTLRDGTYLFDRSGNYRFGREYPCTAPCENDATCAMIAMGEISLGRGKGKKPIMHLGGATILVSYREAVGAAQT